MAEWKVAQAWLVVLALLGAMASVATAQADQSPWPADVKGFVPPAPGEHPRLLFRKSDLPELRKRAATPEVRAKFMKVFQAYQDVIEAHKVDDLMDSQPTKGNKFGGLSTIEEKAFGNIEKIGKACRFVDVLAPAEAPAKGPGLYFMDTSSAAAECCTLQAAAGYVVHMFPTGQGNVIGNPIMPVVKISGNPRTVRTMSEHVDVDVTGILRREMTIAQAGKALTDMVIRTCNGRVTAAEALRHREFVMTKLYRSA